MTVDLFHLAHIDSRTFDLTMTKAQRGGDCFDEEQDLDHAICYGMCFVRGGRAGAKPSRSSSQASIGRAGY